MYICRLFHKDRPFEQIDARILSPGPTRIGRDPNADWTLDDADGTISRIHCTLTVTAGGGLELTDTSTNGTFLDEGRRVSPEVPTSLSVQDSIHVGSMTILIDQTDTALDQADPLKTALRLPVSTAKPVVPGDWADAPAPSARHREASLIEAFCDGAKLDPSALLGQDPADLMRRIGAIYQQTVLGLATLMAERSRLKAEYELERTTIRAQDNNPFKWAPSRRLAQDLLSANPQGFLSDAEAVRACFQEIGAHLAGVAAGATAAAEVTLDTLSPKAIMAEADTRGFSLRGRVATCWDVHNQRYESLTGDQEDNPVRRAFVDAYGQAGTAAN